MPISRFPAGSSSFGFPVLPMTSDVPAGNVFYVCSVQSPDSGASWLAGVDSSSSGDKATPYASANYANTFCKANNGDVIYVLPGHVEAITTAGGLTFNVAGVKVVFLGAGSLRATVSFNATAATMIVSAANVNLYNPRFLSGIDAVVSAIKVQAADFKMYNVEYYDAPAAASTIQLLTTAAANRMVIDGYKYFVSTTGTQKTDGLKIVGGDGIILRNIDISGDFSVSNVDNATTLVTNILLENLNLNNINSGPQPALTLQATSTGFAKNVKCRVASGTTYVSNLAKIQWGLDCEGFNTDGYGGDPIGTAVSTGLEGQVATLVTDMSVPTADLATNAIMSQVIGNKSDTNAGTSILSKLVIPTADVATNVNARDVIGSKADAAVTTVGAVASITAYNKGLLNQVGALVNTGGTATLGGIIGDVVNQPIANRGRLRKSTAIAAAGLTGTTTRFTVAGAVAIYGLGLHITTVLPAGANTLKFSFTPTGGGATDLCGTTDTASAGAEQLFTVIGLKATALVKCTDVGIALLANIANLPIYVGNGVIQTIFSAGPPASGAATVWIEYEPLEVGATVT